MKSLTQTKRFRAFSSRGNSEMCNQNCDNCEYKLSKPADDDGFCYMFEQEPDGDCLQFRLSRRAKQAMARDIRALSIPKA